MEIIRILVLNIPVCSNCNHTMSTNKTNATISSSKSKKPKSRRFKRKKIHTKQRAQTFARSNTTAHFIVTNHTSIDLNAHTNHISTTQNVPAPPTPNSQIVNLSSHLLTQNESSLLSHGLGFCPTPPRIDPLQVSNDIREFRKRLLLRDNFYDPSEENDPANPINLTRSVPRAPGHLNAALLT